MPLDRTYDPLPRQRTGGTTGTAPGPAREPAQAALVHPLAGRRVLVVGINYAPEPTGISPYTTGMAEHLAGVGARVRVLTGVPHYPSWTVPRAHRRTLRRSTAPAPGRVGITRLRHFVPARQTALRRAAYEASFLLHAATVPLPEPPELVLAVTPSLGGALAGGRIARRHGAPLVVVVQDLMAKAAGQSGIAGGSRVAGLTAALERRALRPASRVAIVSEAFRGALRGYGVPDERISPLPNWTHISPSTLGRDEARRRLGWPAEPFTVVHTGNIGLKQDLGNVVAAAAVTAGDAGLRYVVVGDGSQRAAVQRHARGLAGVRFTGTLGEDDYPLALAAADVLLVNERPGVADMSLPSKLTSYLGSGRPVLAAVTPGGATARELERTGGAAEVVEAGRPALLAAAVRRLRDDPERRAAMSAAALGYAATLTPRAAMARLDALLEEALR